MTVRNSGPLIRAPSASAGLAHRSLALPAGKEHRSLALAARKEWRVNAHGGSVIRRGANPQARVGQRHRGVTLLEMLLAMSLLVLLTSMTYWFYGSTLETREKGGERAQRLRLVRVVLDRIATEIRQASVISTDNRLGIKGQAERIWLSTLRVPSRETAKDYSYREQPPPAEYDLVKVEYRIVRHPEILHEEDGYEVALGLGRVEHLIPRPDSLETGKAFEDEGEIFLEPIDEEFIDEDQFFDDFYDEEIGDVSLGPEINWEELYAPRLRFLRFCYFDGYKWWDDWMVTGENPLPQLVMVTVGFDQHAPFGDELAPDSEWAEEFCQCLNEDPVDCLPLSRDQFSTVVRVRQADPFFRSRVTRETQALIQEMSGGEGLGGEQEEGGGGR